MKDPVLIIGAHLAHFHQEAHDRLFGNAGHAHSGTNRTTFDQAVDDLRTSGTIQPPHVPDHAKAALAMSRQKLFVRSFWLVGLTRRYNRIRLCGPTRRSSDL